MVKPIQDKYAGVGNAAWRYIKRIIDEGRCDKCLKAHGDTRTSWKTGEPKVVRMRTCRACREGITEARVREKLYPQK